jgi:tetratricopeptide (TPR) repeat protein
LAQLRWLLEVLLENGQLAESEKLAAEALTAATAESTAEERYPGRGGMSAGAQPLAWLVGIYHQAARPQDVLMLLDESPHWGAKDLAALTSSSYGGIDIDFESFRNRHSTSGSKGNQLVQATATALLAAGRKAEARTLVDHTLNNTGGDDRAYELLLRIAGPEARARLDELFARDQFEERPLIWKAVLLHQAGQHEEAEKLARQAIAIDPSDGEQGQGDRMRVYAVLADIRAARGEPKDAEFFRGVVRAIRLSEQADRFMNAGLMTRAVKMYQDSLLHFADAYCIQSRLAVQLTELGQHELAAKHYEKAFELMPDSFGRVESHCFGCESTFAATQAQGVAERVFTTLVDKNPNKPQVHYLLGYLRLQQQRGQEALPHFRRALELDPDYLNAWTRLQDLSKQYRLPASERDRITLNILRLDPLSRHSSPDLDTVSDLKALWTAVERAQKLRLRPATQLYPLTASKKAIEEQEAKKQPDLSSSHHWGRLGARSSDRTPASALLSHSVIQAIAELMSGSNRADF